MSLLFEISPDDDDGKRKSRRRATAVVVVAEAEPAMQAPVEPRSIIGRVDGGVECADEACCSTIYDIIDNDRGWWLLECWFCGTGQWIEAIDGRLDAPVRAASQFEWPQDGSRFAGKPFAELPARVIEWAAKNDENENTRKACETWIASHAAGV